MLNKSTLTITALVMAASTFAACRPAKNKSELDSLEQGVRLGNVTQKDKEVIIYYANETRPDAAEQANYDYIVSIMNRSDKPLVKSAAEKIKNDPKGFSEAVDADVKQLEDGICKNDKNKTYSLVIFDNGSTRKGKYRYCTPGSNGLKTVASSALKRVYAEITAKNDFRTASNPMVTKEMFEKALSLVKNRFAVGEYSYSLVTKSHGSGEKIMGVRLATRGDVIKARKNGEAEFLKAVEDMAAQKEEAINKALAYRLELQKKLIAAMESLPENHELKDGLLKDAILKDTILKDGLLKDAILKDALLKDTILKDGILKDTILKDTILKDTILKDGILKDAILKDGLLKDGLLKDALLKDSILAASDPADKGILEEASNPAVGITKREWMEIIASFDSEDKAKRMEFHTVFAESCESYLTWDLALDIADSTWNPNIGTLFTSDERGLDSYRTVDYAKFLASVDFAKPFAKQFEDHLNLLANSQKEATSK